MMTDYSKIDQPQFLEIIFSPKQQEKSPLPAGSFDIDIPIDDIIIGCRYYIVSSDAPNILYFHGNGETVNDYNEIGYLYNKHGMNLLVTTYRGYGWSTGSPTVASMMHDATILYDRSVEWLKAKNFTGALFVMGRSLGCVSAIEIARIKEAEGLIIESGFADTAPLAKRWGIDVDALGFNEADGFNNRYKIGKIVIPTFILHGQKDELIPVGEAERLQAFSGARNKQFHIIPGAGHNTMISSAGDLYFESIKRFIDTITGAASWRKRRKAFKNDNN